jgi:hypothetical protein
VVNISPEYIDELIGLKVYRHIKKGEKIIMEFFKKSSE